jgi:uncharacterized protein YecT (DUF1311 family)
MITPISYGALRNRNFLFKCARRSIFFQGVLISMLIPLLAHGSPLASPVICEEVSAHCLQKKDWDNLACIDEAHERSDRKLNQVYRRLVKSKRSEEFIGNLREAQRAWISSRDADCLLESGSHPGSGWSWSLNQTRCLFQKTCNRTKYLLGFSAFPVTPSPP